MSMDAQSTSTSRRPRILHVVTSDLAVVLMRGQLGYLQRSGFDVTVISSPGNWLDEAGRIENVQTIRVPMERGLAPLSDLVSVWRLWRTMRALRPVVTNVSTPKAGLLGGFAAWLSRVPCRFYTLRGLRFETAKGLRRRLLVYAEVFACGFAHRVICVSQSLRNKAIASGITSRERTVVFGSGSSNGVDASCFAPTPERIRRASDLRSALGVPPQVQVLGFVGRLTRDKGISELVESFLRLGHRFPDLRLLVLGRFEKEDPLPTEIRKFLENHPRVIFPGHTLSRRKAEERMAASWNHSDFPSPAGISGPRQQDGPVGQTAPYYAMMDVFVLPTHREGFPNVVLEAHAAGKAVVAARATGVVDAIVDGETGLLFPIGDAIALAEALARLLRDKGLANKLARAGQERVRREFRQERIWKALYEEYSKLLKSRHLPLPAMRCTDRTSESGVEVR